MSARPLRADARANVSRLTEAALDCFRDEGLGAPLDRIAKAAGVSQGTLYNRFGGRDGLIDAVLPHLLADGLDTLEAELREVADPGERLAIYVRGLVEMQGRDTALGDVVSGRYSSSAEVAAACTRTLATATEIIADGVASGTLVADLTADDIQALLISTGAVRAHAQDPADAERRAQRVTELFLRSSRQAD
ncbi:TetR/AcrR family transcriptional regulator [Gordonia sp. NPDC062954]|uniref:TetR/AcrR family transcriptional regulator n=1 Tax=Gordonia sp. NPDC062954 TaxID=3364003 RepID=UPI0037C58D8E